MTLSEICKNFVGKQIIVELKNEVSMSGTLVHFDSYFNLSMEGVSPVDTEKHQQLINLKNCVIRGSTISYILLPQGVAEFKDMNQDALKGFDDINSISATSATTG
ncbi:MAG: U6 snRNA-associated Sm-like protein LSm2 [Marteilia pararefringens]